MFTWALLAKNNNITLRSSVNIFPSPDSARSFSWYSSPVTLTKSCLFAIVTGSSPITSLSCSQQK
ncbi:Uncharacterised protein [Vibrio cholerae]|nr:Uncharacterised protein [Vibrio cholerae]